MKKVHNKLLFDNKWFQQILREENSHFSEMSLILAYFDPRKLTDAILAKYKHLSTVNEKRNFEQEIIFQIKDSYLPSQETLTMIEFNFKKLFVSPTK